MNWPAGCAGERPSAGTRWRGTVMKRLASLVLRHKLLVVLTCLTLAVAGFATISTTTHWMTATFALPGQPGYVTDTRIAALYHNGGGQTPTVLTLTVPAGSSPRRRLGARHRVADAATTGDPIWHGRRAGGLRLGLHPAQRRGGRACPTGCVSDVA